MIAIALASALTSLAFLTAKPPITYVLQEAQPTPSDLVYTFRTSETGDRRHDSDMTGTVRVHGGDVRIDVDHGRDDNDPGSYLLVLDNGTRMLSVHPSRHEAEEMSAAGFERIVGTSLRAVGPIVHFNVGNVAIATERLGAGGAMLGYVTQHVRLTEHYTVHITAMGFDGGEETMAVQTDYWVVPGLQLGRNPLLGLLERASAAMAQSDASFVRQEDAARAALMQGSALRTVTEVTSLRREAQPASLFEVPAGYKVKSASEGFEM
jgi:hypothetical protein